MDFMKLHSETRIACYGTRDGPSVQYYNCIDQLATNGLWPLLPHDSIEDIFRKLRLLMDDPKYIPEYSCLAKIETYIRCIQDSIYGLCQQAWLS